ncbi:ATP phosphoribosyltransferase [Helicobacter sp. 13S00401-1]|uniref:ATP phosphoribosyltransferase n=1 Tax=Helicobacter sp. 13S00401-1 TaxID=1905758 RepID=UPI000BA55F45|nr:ATP phosphoribosyltransferase [Helicobacter sp. 13S00401-1]PAF51889.1 ATP phosphoribosyltransferase [Helicobacter sp. 13S00401-1]
MLTIALPKGRIGEDTLILFSKIFNTNFSFNDRKLILEHGGFRFLLVRNQDVPTYVQYGAANLGVVGLDILEEGKAPVVRLLNLGFGKCKVVVGTECLKPLDLQKPRLKIATKLANITKHHFAKKAIAIDVIKLYGSIELAPLVGLSDAIVDIVETGTTMKQNNLEVYEVIMDSSAYLVANKNSFFEYKDEILALREKCAKALAL